MLVALTLTASVTMLVAHTAIGQLRFFRGVGEVVALRGQIGHAGTVASRLLWAVSSTAGDITVAQDTAIELHATLGTSVACGGSAGQLTIPAPVASGNALTAFIESPEAGDRVHVFFDDSLGGGWLTLRVASSTVSGAACPHFPSVSAASTLELLEPLIVPPGAPLRFTRPIRLSLYRASDSRWYLGLKDWNGATEQFNTIQPVAGPLRSYNGDRARTGLLFVYRDASGSELPQPVNPFDIVAVGVTTRAESLRPVRVSGLASQPGGAYADSLSLTIGLRNAR